MSHLSTDQVAEMASITKRHLQRMLARGVAIPGASKTAGGHWKIKDSPSLRKWAKEFERWRGRPRAAAILPAGWKDELRKIGIQARKPIFSGKSKMPQQRISPMTLQYFEEATPEDIALAKEIARHQQKAIEKSKSAVKAIEEAIVSWRKAAALADVAFAKNGGSSHRFLEWWEKHLLPIAEARRLMTISRTPERADKDSLRRMGILADRDLQRLGRRKRSN
jgi:DNA-binding transcriptional regulator YiaG